MGQFSTVQSFNQGEVAPEFYDRTDVDFYQGAVRRLDNWFPLPGGGVTTRPPLELVGAVAANAGQVPHTSTLIAKEVNGGILWVALFWEFSGSDYRVSCRFGLLERQGGVWVLASQSALTPLGTFTADLTLFGTSVVAGAGLANLSAEVTSTSVGPAVFLASRWFPPQRFFITAAGVAQQEAVSFFEELLGIADVTQGSPEVVGIGTLFTEQLTAGDTLVVGDETFTVSTITDDANLTLSGNIVGVSRAGLRMTTPVSAPFGGEFPRLVTFHKNRLCFFATETRPTAFWASKSNDPFTIVPGSIYDNAPIEVDLFSDGVDQFKWVVSLDQLYVGTSDGEYIIQVTAEGALTPTNFSFFRIGVTGGESVPPVTLDGAVIHVARASSQIISSQFDFSRQNFSSSDLSIFAPHLLTGAVQSMAYRPPRRGDPAGRFFMVLSDGAVRSFSLNTEQGIRAWGRITLATPAPTPLAVATLPDAAFFLLRAGTQVSVVALGELRDSIAELDFRAEVSPTTVGGFIYDMPPLLQDRAVAAFSATEGFIGVFDTDAQADLTGVSTTGLGDLSFGVPYSALCELLPARGNDQRGGLLNRRRRIVRTRVSVQDTFQLQLNQLPLLGDVAPVVGGNVPSRTCVLEARHLGWSDSEDSSFGTDGVYRATVLSVTREIGQ